MDELSDFEIVPVVDTRVVLIFKYFVRVRSVQELQSKSLADSLLWGFCTSACMKLPQ
jgi:hypothetical protein